MNFTLSFWIGFFIFVLIALAIDLGISNKKPKTLTFKEAATLTGVWILLASIFCTIIYFYSDRQKALEFITGYVVELSLSMDNVFIFVLIFSYFKVPPNYQHSVLFWGIIGAIVMRFIMIFGGIYLFQTMEWLFYVFGIVLIYSGIKIVFYKENANMSSNTNSVINFISKYIKVSKDYHGDKFFIIENGKRVITPLFIVLFFIEKTDLIFALDSIPAIIAITQDPFIVFTSNIFAILGLRSLYFMLANLMERFSYMKFGLSIILVFVGCKMIGNMLGYHITIEYSLLFIISVLILSILISLYLTKKSVQNPPKV